MWANRIEMGVRFYSLAFNATLDISYRLFFGRLGVAVLNPRGRFSQCNMVHERKKENGRRGEKAEEIAREKTY